ncbi:MAG: M15 family metallopeptidase [Actinobacteria bacterium]|nr:M15 family metallopeptidase [Actinomycetota bacterium]
MSLRRTSLGVAVIAVVAVFASALGIDAAPPVDTIPQGAVASATAEYTEQPFDAISVFQTGEITPAVRDAALLAATAANAPAVVTRGFTAGMLRLRRGATVVQQATGPGWAYPMAVSALPFEAVGPVMGRDVASVLAQAQLVMGATSAGIRGAQVGDIVDFMGPAGTVVSFMIGRIGTDEEVGGTEFVMSFPMADMLGATLSTRVLIFGQFDRAAVVTSLMAAGLYNNSKVKIRHSWDPPDPDATLGMAATKAILGEFDIYYAGLSDLGWTAMSSTWVGRFLPTIDTYPGGIRARCNVVIKADLQAALQEVYASGLGGFIDVGNVNSYGGCGTGTARLARITQNLGSVSRHSWGQPIDMNTTSNCQGCVPRMDCRIVRIFRKHNFAWGGNFLTPDGMHFEWVGEARNTQQFPSKYCQNTPDGRVQGIGSGAAPPTQRDTLFADDGLVDE